MKGEKKMRHLVEANKLKAFITTEDSGVQDLLLVFPFLSCSLLYFSLKFLFRIVYSYALVKNNTGGVLVGFAQFLQTVTS